MGVSLLANSINKIVSKSAKNVGRLQVGVNKILWGVNNRIPTVGKVSQQIKDSKVGYKFSQNTPAPAPPGQGENLVTSGLFNALDVLNEVDLCNVIGYLTDVIHLKKKPRPPKPWTAAQTALFTLQDKAALVQKFIDKYMAYPNVFIGSYVGTGPNAVPINQAVSQSGAPSQGGSDVQKYNLYFLMQSIKDTFSFNGPDSLFTAEDKTILSTVPGLGGNLNIIDDFIGTIDKYSDYRNIPNEDLQNLISKINTVRSVCVTIQNLDFKNALALIGNFLGVDIRAQIQKLSDFLNPMQIIPTLKEINSALRGFIKIGQQIQGLLSLGQFIIKLALIFSKVFEFIIQFFLFNPAPGIGLTAGIIARFESAKGKAKDETDGVTRVLKAVNAFLQVLVIFIRYLVTNANELLRRLDILLFNLEGCEAVKDSDVVAELQETRKSLVALREQLETYLTQYDSKTNPDTAMFGIYDIRIVDEEVTDPAIPNKRRRGIALAPDGQLVTQSDLTFATNPTVIIGEVQQKLLALGLVSTGQGMLDAATLDTVAQSINYLDSNDIAENGLNIDRSGQENVSAAQSANINSFIDDLPGGAQFKQKSQAISARNRENIQKQVQQQKTAPSGSTTPVK